MDETPFGLRVKVALDYDEAVERTTTALKEEGFGVLTTIDVKQTLKQKLDADFRKYVILGACNPALAHRALQAEIEIGLLLPCNLVVYETGPKESVVAAMAPLPTIGVVGDNPALGGVAREADERLRRVLMSLEARACVGLRRHEETGSGVQSTGEIVDRTVQRGELDIAYSRGHTRRLSRRRDAASRRGTFRDGAGHSVNGRRDVFVHQVVRKPLW